MSRRVRGWRKSWRRPRNKRSPPQAGRQAAIASLAIAAIVCHLLMVMQPPSPAPPLVCPSTSSLSLLPSASGVVLLVFGLVVKLCRRQFGLGPPGGPLHRHLSRTRPIPGGNPCRPDALRGEERWEAYAVRSASSVLAALAKCMPSTVHGRRDGGVADVRLEDVTALATP